jgi:hypothetical protein
LILRSLAIIMVIVIIIKVERCASAIISKCNNKAGEIDYIVAIATIVRYAIVMCNSD